MPSIAASRAFDLPAPSFHSYRKKPVVTKLFLDLVVFWAVVCGVACVAVMLYLLFFPCSKETTGFIYKLQVAWQEWGGLLEKANLLNTAEQFAVSFFFVGFVVLIPRFIFTIAAAIYSHRTISQMAILGQTVGFAIKANKEALMACSEIKPREKDLDATKKIVSSLVRSSYNNLCTHLANLGKIITGDETVECAIRISYIDDVATKQEPSPCGKNKKAWVYRTIGRSSGFSRIRELLKSDVRWNEGLAKEFSAEEKKGVPAYLKRAGLIIGNVKKVKNSIFKQTPSDALNHIGSIIAVPIFSPGTPSVHASRSKDGLPLIGILFFASPRRGWRSPFRVSHVLLLRTLADHVADLCHETSRVLDQKYRQFVEGQNKIAIQ